MPGSPQLQDRTGPDQDGLVHGDGLFVQQGRHIPAGDGNDVVPGKAQGGTQHGGLQGAQVPGVAHQDIGQLEGLRIHGTGGRDAELLIAIPAAVLNGGEHTGGFYENAHVQPSFS